jgi:chemotaxis protein MotB
MSAARAAVLLLALLAAACITRASHEAAVARMRSLEHQRAQRAEELAELRRRNAALHAVGSRLAVERSSLDSEKSGLLGEIEDLRAEHEKVLSALEDEQRQRQRREAEIQSMSGSYRSLVEELEREVEQGKIEIHQLRGRLQVRALERLLFDSGSAELKPEGAEVLRSVAAQLARVQDHTIRVEGHTDDVPIHTERFPSNWELSVARAAGVVRALEASGMPPERLSAQGFGPHQPIASNADPSGRARNRRIEIVLVPGSEE